MFVSKTSNNKCAKFRFWTRTIIFTPSVQIWMPPQTVLRTWASGYIWQHIFLQKVLQIIYSIALPARRPPENWCRKYLYKKVAAWHKNATWVHGKLSEKVKIMIWSQKYLQPKRKKNMYGSQRAFFQNCWNIKNCGLNSEFLVQVPFPTEEPFLQDFLFHQLFSRCFHHLKSKPNINLCYIWSTNLAPMHCPV